MAQQELILIAEDELDAVKLLQFHLHRRGYRTVAATDGRAALNVIFERQPALVILDLMLPGLHGYEVCRLAKGASGSRHIPILILTALAATEDRIRGFKLGADDYLTKPFDTRELMARVNYLLLRKAQASSGFDRPDRTPSRSDR